MQHPTDRLVGRADELDALDRLLAELARRQPCALELAGEPGIGKTRLLAELQARADAAGRLVLAGSASELEVELPFWVFVDALDEYVHGLEPGRLDAMDPDARSELAHVLPSLDAGADLVPERYRTHRAMRQLLEALARDGPLLLVLDDVHWADPGSVELLGSLLRRPPEGVLIALGLRPRQLPERLRGPLERAWRAGTLTRVELGPLSAEDARALLGGAVSGELYDGSGGNPFYLQQLARFPGARTVSAALAEELAPLPGPTRRVLEAAAVVGDPFEPELAAAAAAVPEQEAVDALDVLLRADLIRPTQVPRRFGFRHPLVRSAVYETAPAGWRLGAHQRAADALAARGAPALERAHHVERSARQGDAEAAAVLQAAGETTLLRAPAIATGWFAAALRILPSQADRFELLTSLAAAHASIGRYDAAHAALLEALELAPEEVRLELVAQIAGLELVTDAHERAHARLAAVIDALPDRRSRAAAVAMTEMARLEIFRGRYPSMRDWAVRALEAARAVGDPAVMSSPAALVALAHGFLGEVAAGKAACAEAAAIVAAMSEDELAARLDAPSNLAAAEFYLERLEQASAHAERALALGRASGHGDLFLAGYGIVGNIRMLRGDIRGAAEFWDAAVETTRLIGNPQLTAWNLVNRSLTATAEGDAATALAAAEEAREMGSLTGTAHAWSGMAQAEALLAAGEPARGEAALMDAAGGDDLPDLPGGSRARGLEILARCRLAGGGDAERAARAARELADASGLPLAAALADSAEATVALAAGDAGAAIELARSAAARADGAGAPLDAAAARLLAGRALALLGEPERAAEQLEAAAAQYDTCGAERRRDAAERELGKLGRRRHRRARGSGIAALSERELQVARLIVDRRTNPEIASELYLSVKTVESHVRNLFHKLDVSSRADVARVVEQADRAPAPG
jgi:DNA-binding NarL/FixJ family response regulator/tetratricopeptide (TPR) repeat protein